VVPVCAPRVGAIEQSTVSWGVLESFRVLTLPAPSGMRTSEELGWGEGSPKAFCWD